MTWHVLVADDEPHIGRIIQTKLEQGPFRVTIVSGGNEALAALAEYPDVSLVLLDLMMPGRSGLEVLAEMRANPRWSRVPCIILTAAGQDQRYEEAMRLGASDYMTKPFSPKRLYARVAELVGAVEEGRAPEGAP
ncbi:MAG TPA: response regulator transcription factor [Gemmatimonadaceae bacterium]|nr:response regulator transcription factor [Gemmatimonadaceae bacterium]